MAQQPFIKTLFHTIIGIFAILAVLLGGFYVYAGHINPSFGGKVTRYLSRYNCRQLEKKLRAANPHVAKECTIAIDYVLSRSSPLPMSLEWPKSPVLVNLGNGGPGFTNLEPLRGIPLCYLWLTSSDITDLSALDGTKLENLDLMMNPNLKSLESLREMKSLRSLVLSYTAVKDLSPIAGLKLHVLWAEDCDLTDLSPMSGMSLQNLLLSGNSRLENIDALKGMTSLRILYLSNTAVSDLTPLVGIHLNVLDINGTPAAKLPLPAGIDQKTVIGYVSSAKAVPAP